MAIQNLIAAKTLHGVEKLRDGHHDDFKTISNPKGNTAEIIAYIDNRQKFDPKEIEQRFKKQIPVLQEDEEVKFAFKYGANLFLYTTDRALSIEIDRLKSKKIEFVTLPYKRIQGFSVQSAGNLRRTVKATLLTTEFDGPGKMEFVEKNLKIFEISNVVFELARKCLRATKQES